MSSYLNDSHRPWLPRHCVISVYNIHVHGSLDDLQLKASGFNSQRHLDMCASAANAAINKMIGRYSPYQTGIGFSQGKKNP